MFFILFFSSSSPLYAITIIMYIWRSWRSEKAGGGGSAATKTRRWWRGRQWRAQEQNKHSTTLLTTWNVAFHICLLCSERERSAYSLEDVKLVLYKWFSCYDTKPSESRLVSSPENKLETVLIMLRERHGIAVLLLYGWFGINWEDMCAWCMEWWRRRRCNMRRRSCVITDGEWWIWKIFKDERAEHRKAIFHFLVKHFFFISLWRWLSRTWWNEQQTNFHICTNKIVEWEEKTTSPTDRTMKSLVSFTLLWPVLRWDQKVEKFVFIKLKY